MIWIKMVMTYNLTLIVAILKRLTFTGSNVIYYKLVNNIFGLRFKTK